jgi:hypothetical protein
MSKIMSGKPQLGKIISQSRYQQHVYRYWLLLQWSFPLFWPRKIFHFYKAEANFVFQSSVSYLVRYVNFVYMFINLLAPQFYI